MNTAKKVSTTNAIILLATTLSMGFCVTNSKAESTIKPKTGDSDKTNTVGSGDNKPVGAGEGESKKEFYYCADRSSFPSGIKYFDYDSHPWKEEDRVLVSKLMEQIKRAAPGIVSLASQHGPIPLLKSPYIPYKNILGKTTNAHVLAVDGAMFIADGAETQKDLKRILLHELVHMADLGRHVAYSTEWSNFARPALQRARRQVSCQFLLDSKAEDFADPRWPSTESCTSFKESLCEFGSRYVLDEKFRKEHKKAAIAIQPLLNPNATDIEFAKHFMAGRLLFRNDRAEEAIPEFELASKADSLAPSPHVFLAQCWFEKKDLGKAREELKKANELFDRAHITLTESLHWRTLSMLANSLTLDEKFSDAREILDRLASSRIQYDASIFSRRALCNEKLGDLQRALLDFYTYEYLVSHSLEPAHYFDFVEDKEFLQNFLAKSFSTPDGRRSHVFSICWERLAQAAKGDEKNRFIDSALAEVKKAASAGYYSKDEDFIRKRYLAYLKGTRESDFAKLKETDKKFWQEFELLRYLSGKPLPPKSSEEFATLLRGTRPTDPKDTKWLF